MFRSKKFGQIAITLIGFCLVLTIAFLIGQGKGVKHQAKQGHSVQTTRIQSSHSTSSSGDSAAQQPADNGQNSTQADLATYNALPTPTKVALLIFNQFHNHSNTHYSVYMGDRDKIVVVDDGEGGLASSSVAEMYTDNHDGSYSYATIESSATAFSDYTPSNSYWKTVGSVNVSEMLAIYQSRVNEVNQLTNLLDLSKSTQSFTFLPTNQTTAP